jgi:hypothetical protein
MRKEIKIRLHNIISKSTLQYGSETWILGAEVKRRIETGNEISKIRIGCFTKR